MLGGRLVTALVGWHTCTHLHFFVSTSYPQPSAFPGDTRWLYTPAGLVYMFFLWRDWQRCFFASRSDATKRFHPVPFIFNSSHSTSPFLVDLLYKPACCLDLKERGLSWLEARLDWIPMEGGAFYWECDHLVSSCHGEWLCLLLSRLCSLE